MTTDPSREDRGHGRWIWTRENVLIAAGLIILGVELINAEILGRTFHYEFLFLGASLCGVGIAQLGDRK